MKIGLVLPGFSSNERDWCIPALLDFVRGLATVHTVHVFALEYPYRRDIYSVYGATVHSMNGKNRGKRHAPRLWFDTLSAIRTEHRRAPFGILHAFWVNEPSQIAILAGRALNVPVIVSVAGGELIGLRHIDYGGQLRWIERTMVRWSMRAADCVTVGSRYLQTIAASWRENVCVVPLGVDVNLFSPSQRSGSKQPIKILNVGSLIPVKGQRQLLRAFAQFAPHDACLEIVGSGTLEKHLRGEASSLRIADRVEISRTVAHDELAQKYRAADLFVQASLHEAQGMAVLEAAACGKPIVATPVGVVPELADSGGAIAARGFGVDDLAAAMASALEARTRLGRRACEIVERDFALEATWRRWMKLYQQMRRG
jgi:glycosyltransferase involved in cell wall biosynthesis